MVLSRALNAGVLPSDYYALPEQSIRGPIPDVLTLRLSEERDESNETLRHGIGEWVSRLDELLEDLGRKIEGPPSPEDA